KCQHVICERRKVRKARIKNTPKGKPFSRLSAKCSRLKSYILCKKDKNREEKVYYDQAKADLQGQSRGFSEEPNWAPEEEKKAGEEKSHQTELSPEG
ncbi:Os02g0724850, partial [Oryza sativa Japonica Group]